MLDEEIKGLPEKYQAPLILYYLQGLSQAETARRLGCPAGTVGSRLARARERLRRRLLRRGLSPSADSLGIMLATKEISTSVPTALVGKTVQAAMSAASGVASRAGAASLTTLVAGVSRTMTWARALTAATVLGGLGMVAIGVVFVTQIFPNEVVTAMVQGNSASTVIAGSARAAEPILLAMQTAAPASGTKAGQPQVDEKTERAIKSGLAWLASQQRDDGSFGMGSFQGAIANTSLAAVALMAVDSEPGRSPYRVRVEKALHYVMRTHNPRASSTPRSPRPPTARCTTMPSASSS